MSDEPRHWFQPLAAFLGKTYWAPDTGRVMAFTKGTEQEVAFLWEALGLSDGARVLDVGCGPGRHSLALAHRGARVTGVDISEQFIDLARTAADDGGLSVDFQVGDARRLSFDAEFDAAICLCQGAFGLPEGPGDDVEVFAGLVRALRPGAMLALSAFSAYFAVRFLEEDDTFDAGRGVNHERATLRDGDGHERQFDLWTSCWTPRELRQVAAAAGLAEVAVYSVTPGKYAAESPNLDTPEFLLVARKPAPPVQGAKIQEPL